MISRSAACTITSKPSPVPSLLHVIRPSPRTGCYLSSAMQSLVCTWCMAGVVVPVLKIATDDCLVHALAAAPTASPSQSPSTFQALNVFFLKLCRRCEGCRSSFAAHTHSLFAPLKHARFKPPHPSVRPWSASARPAHSLALSITPTFSFARNLNVRVLVVRSVCNTADNYFSPVLAAICDLVRAKATPMLLFIFCLKTNC